METLLKCHKPVELNFRKCTIVIDKHSGDKHVQLDELPYLKKHDIVFDANLFEVGETFYAYLIENKYFSGKADDYRCTLVNISKKRPKLIGNDSIGALLLNCSSGSGKPPNGSKYSNNDYSQFINNRILYNHNKSRPIFHEIINCYKSLFIYNSTIKFINLAINDLGLPIIIFSSIKIQLWERFEYSNLEVNSKFGISYNTYRHSTKNFIWNQTPQ